MEKEMMKNLYIPRISIHLLHHKVLNKQKPQDNFYKNTLINKILELAGVVMKQADVVGFAEKKDIQETQKEIS